MEPHFVPSMVRVSVPCSVLSFSSAVCLSRMPARSYQAWKPGFASLQIHHPTPPSSWFWLSHISPAADQEPVEGQPLAGVTVTRG